MNVSGVIFFPSRAKETKTQKKKKKTSDLRLSFLLHVSPHKKENETQRLIPPFILSFIHTYILSFILSFTHCFILVYIHSFAYSFTQSYLYHTCSERISMLAAKETTKRYRLFVAELIVITNAYRHCGAKGQWVKLCWAAV